MFVIQAATQRGITVTQYDLVKTLFIADLNHLKNYGRPVTYDNHVAMEHGPVPSEAYDMLKQSYNWRARFDLDGPPWASRPAPERGARAFAFENIAREPDLRCLSKSDISALNNAFDYVAKEGFKKVRDWTHEHVAYKTAWERRRFRVLVPSRIVLEFDDVFRGSINLADQAARSRS